MSMSSRPRPLLPAAFLALALLLTGCGSQDDLVDQIKRQNLPYVETIVPPQGTAGQPFNLRGFGFGAEAGEIYISDGAAGAVVPVTVEHWQDDLIAARFPDIPGKGRSVPLALFTKDRRTLAFNPTVIVVSETSSSPF